MSKQMKVSEHEDCNRKKENHSSRKPWHNFPCTTNHGMKMKIIISLPFWYHSGFLIGCGNGQTNRLLCYFQAYWISPATLLRTRFAEQHINKLPTFMLLSG